MSRFVASGLVFVLCGCHSPGIRGIFTPLPPRSEIARLELNEFQDDGSWRLLAETTQEAHIDRFLETVRNIKGVWHPEGIHFGTSHQIVVKDAQQQVLALDWFDANRISANLDGRLISTELRSTANDQIALLAVFGRIPPEWREEDANQPGSNPSEMVAPQGELKLQDTTGTVRNSVDSKCLKAFTAGRKNDVSVSLAKPGAIQP